MTASVVARVRSFFIRGLAVVAVGRDLPQRTLAGGRRDRLTNAFSDYLGVSNTPSESRTPRPQPATRHFFECGLDVRVAALPWF
jgi:hypothetical protein